MFQWVFSSLNNQQLLCILLMAILFKDIYQKHAHCPIAGGVEEVTGVGVDAGEQNKVFSDTVLASPQPEPLPGNLI